MPIFRTLFLLAFGCSGLLGEEFAFEQYEVVIGLGKRPTVLTGFLRGGARAELVVVKIDANGDRRVQIYGFDSGAWGLVLEATLRPGVLFVDVANAREVLGADHAAVGAAVFGRVKGAHLIAD